MLFAKYCFIKDSDIIKVYNKAGIIEKGNGSELDKNISKLIDIDSKKKESYFELIDLEDNQLENLEVEINKLQLMNKGKGEYSELKSNLVICQEQNEKKMK